MLEKDDVLDSKFSIHDKYRFEVKLDLGFRKERKSLYNLEYYFFLPRSLNITPESYTKEMFYSSTQHYIRFKTPEISIEKLFTPSNTLSPFNRAMSAIDQLSSGQNGDFLTETICDELKLLGAIIRADLRDTVDYIIKEPSAQLKTRRIEILIDEVKIISTCISDMRAKIISSKIPQRVADTFFAMDEYTSLMINEYLTDVLKCAQENNCLVSKELFDKLCETISLQIKYRKSMGYSSLLIPDGDNSHFLYWRSLLKKFISSSLYLHPEMSDFNILTHTGPAIAAGLAMLFAIIVTIYAQSKYAINSAAFVMIIVISYIFKDRIKDWLKIIFSRKMATWLYDRKLNVTEPAHGLRIGHIKETFSYIPHSRLPADIEKIRKADNRKSIEEEAKFEKIFKYKRELFLDFENIERYHNRRRGLIDILRFSIFDFLKHADNEIVNYDYFDENVKAVRQKPCIRIYHINLVVKYNISKETFAYERLRLLVTREGIFGIEEVRE